eukprot:485520-Rhodomonas_salina.5
MPEHLTTTSVLNRGVQQCAVLSSYAASGTDLDVFGTDLAYGATRAAVACTPRRPSCLGALGYHLPGTCPLSEIKDSVQFVPGMPLISPPAVPGTDGVNGTTFLVPADALYRSGL